MLEAALAATSKEHGGRRQAVDHEERALVSVAASWTSPATHTSCIPLARQLDRSLDRHVERMGKEHPGLDLSRADAVRSLLTRALDQIEGPSAPTKRGGR